MSDYDPLAEFQRELDGRSRTPPRLPPTTAAPKKYNRYATDDDLVAEGVSGIGSGKWSNPRKAAEALADRAEGTGYNSTVDRLRKKIGAALAD
jgi:hypothetical protein